MNKKGFAEIVIIGTIALALLATVSLFFYGKFKSTPLIVGATFSPVQAQQTTLSGAGITSVQTTIPLTSFTSPAGVALVMSNFGSIGYATIEPNSSKIEDISFTGITQNANGSATLTGVTRGMDFVSPYTASSTLQKSHAGGSYLITSNTAGFYGQQFVFQNQVASSTAVISFNPNNPPQYYPSTGLQHTGTYNSTTSELASVDYVNQVALVSAPNASTGAKGVVQIGTGAQAQAGTGSGSTGALLVPPNSLFNSTQSSAIIIPVTNSSGKLSQAFLDLTQAFTWTGANIFTSSTNTFNSLVRFNVAPEFGTFNATSTAVTATSTISANLQILKNATTTNLTISNVCVGCTSSGYARVTNTGTGPTTANTYASVTATCTAPAHIVGGGASNSDITTAQQLNLMESYPSSTSVWTVTYHCGPGGCGANTMTAYAMCLNP